MTTELRDFLRKFSDDMKSDDVSLFLYRDSSPDSPLELYSVGHHTKLKDLAVPRDMGIVGWVAQNNEPVFTNDTANDERFSDAVDMISGFETHSILAVPVLYKTTVIGVLEAINKGMGEDFTEDDLTLSIKAARDIIEYIPSEKIMSILGT